MSIESIVQIMLVKQRHLEHYLNPNVPDTQLVCELLAALANNPGYSADQGQRELNSRLHQLSGLRLAPKNYAVVQTGEGIFFLVPHQDPEAAGTTTLPESARPPFVCFPKNRSLVFAVPTENQQGVSYLSLLPFTANGIFQTAVKAIFEPGNPAEDYVAAAFQAATTALHASPITA